MGDTLLVVIGLSEERKEGFRGHRAEKTEQKLAKGPILPYISSRARQIDTSALRVLPI